MDYDLIALEIETPAFAASKVHQYMGSNVKSPGLVKGQRYVVKFWSLKSVKGGDNQYWIGQFLGAGQSVDRILDSTPRPKELSTEQKYFFKRVDGTIVEAGNFSGALVLDNDLEQRITFYALLGEPKLEAVQLAGATVRNLTPRPERDRPTNPAKAPRPIKLTRRRQPRAVSDVDKVENDDATEFYRNYFAKPPQAKQLMFAARFRTSEEATSFATKFSDGEYVHESLWHTAMLPAEGNADIGFFSKAKEAGATEVFNFTRLV